MKKFAWLPAFVGGLFVSSSFAISLDDIQLWTGSGTNRAALVIEWSSPEVFNSTALPAPLTDKALVWGYRFNGTATGTAMLDAIVAADPRLYVGQSESFGTYVQAIGYNLKSDGVLGLTDGTHFNAFTNGFLNNPSVNLDVAHPLNPGDLYWGGAFGPNWELWTEVGGQGGFLSSPKRGPNPYWTPDDPNSPYSGVHGEWEYAQSSLDSMSLTNGSWVGFTVTAGGDNYLDDSDPGTIAFNLHKHAPVSPDGLMTAYVANANDFAVQIVSADGVYTNQPYNDPNAILNRPTQDFLDYIGDGTIHRVKIIEPPYWTAPNGSNVITEITSGGQITVALGRKLYDDPSNPYGIDLIVYGNSFFSASGTSGFIGDATDLDTARLSSGYGGHAASVSVSQDGTNWFTFANTPTVFPDNAYRWDTANHGWTPEETNPTKPLNPSIYAGSFGGEIVADLLAQFVGASGGTGFDLKASGFPWIQYVRVQPASGTYAVIDAIAAVNPVVVGDALLVTPTNVTNGLGRLTFQNPANPSQTLIDLNVRSISDSTRVSTIALAEFSSLAPIPGALSSAFKITAQPMAGTNAITLVSDVSFRAGPGYAGNGSDLRVFAWGGANWLLNSFTFDAGSSTAHLAGISNLTSFVVAKIISPQLTIHAGAGGYTFQFNPLPGWTHVLESSPDFKDWTMVALVTPTSSQTVTLQDNSSVVGRRFYRLRLMYQ